MKNLIVIMAIALAAATTSFAYAERDGKSKR